MRCRNQASFSNLSSTLQGHSLLLWLLSCMGRLVRAHPSAQLMLWGHSRKSCHWQRCPLILLALADSENVIPPIGSSGVTLEGKEVWWSWSKALCKCSPLTNWNKRVNFLFIFLAVKKLKHFIGEIGLEKCFTSPELLYIQFIH